MKRTKVLQEIRVMRFDEAYHGWQRGHLTQEEAGLLLGMSERNFRRYIERYHQWIAGQAIDSGLSSLCAGG